MSRASLALRREPLHEHAGPAVVVGAGGEFRDVVGGRVNFEAGDFPEIVHGVGGVGGAATDAEDEEATATVADADEFLRALFDGDGIKLGDDFGGLFEMLDGVGHEFFKTQNGAPKQSGGERGFREIPRAVRRTFRREAGRPVR
jgi:hypothetical protein